LQRYVGDNDFCSIPRDFSNQNSEIFGDLNILSHPEATSNFQSVQQQDKISTGLQYPLEKIMSTGTDKNLALVIKGILLAKVNFVWSREFFCLWPN